MKKILFSILMLASSAVFADTWLQQMSAPDKVGHYASGATIAAVGSIFFSPEVGLGATVIAAIGKEYYDYKHPATHQVEKNDAIATILGGVLVYAAIKNDHIKLSYTPNGTPVLNYSLALK